MRTAVTVAAAIATVLLAAGCSGNDNHESAAKSSSSPPPPAQNTTPTPSAQDTTPDESGKLTFTYEDAQSDAAVKGRSLMMDADMLENVTQNANDILTVPGDVPVTGKQCDDASSYWDGTGIVMCYEDVESETQTFADAGDPDAATSGVNGNIAAFYHELAHATIALFGLVFTGKEEDVADEGSAFFLLAPGADGKPDPNGVQVGMAAVRILKLSSDQEDANDIGFWDTHAPDPVRMYNWACYVYGSDPEGNAALVTDGLLPQERADGCEGEFDKMSAAWEQMLGPHLKKPS